MIKSELYCGDNLDILSGLPDGCVDMVYADPPFFTQKNWDDFDDRFDDIGTYTMFLKIRMYEMKRILKSTGSIYVHLDHHAVHHVKVMMDDIFGANRFKTMITWRRCGSKGNAKGFANNSDYILYYTKGNKNTFNIQYGEYSEATLAMYKYDDHDGRGKYASDNISAPGGKGYHYSLGLGENQPPGGYRWKKETMLKNIEDNIVIIKQGKVPRQKRYKSDRKGVPFDNVWTDIENVKKPIYPTEKPPELLDRIIRSSSNPGDLILDPFCGCGTAVMSAQKLGRRWIGIDVSPTSCRLMTDRLRKIGYSIGESDIVDLPQTADELKNMEHFEFQNWAVQQLGGRQVQSKTGDRGIDGYTFVGDPIQVKQSEKAGSPVVRLFAQDIRDIDKTNGIIVALSFSKGAYTEVEHVHEKHGITIELKSVSDMI